MRRVTPVVVMNEPGQIPVNVRQSAAPEKPMPGTHTQDVAPVVSRGQSLGNDRSGPQADGAEIETLRVVTGEEPPLLEQRKETVNEPVGVD